MTQDLLLFVGTLNRKVPYAQGAHGDGLSVFALDEDRLSFRRIAHFSQIDNPTYLSVTPDGRRIYANSEVSEWKEGLVTAFAFDPDNGQLDYLNTQPTLGNSPAHNAISDDGKRLFVANYTDGDGGPDCSLAVFGIRADGSLTPALAGIAHSGSGPVSSRQQRAHAHSVTALPDGSVIVADLGADTLFSYRLQADGLPLRRATTRTAPGAGPRHAALHPTGRLLFVINELDSTITTHVLDLDSGMAAITDRCSTLPGGSQAGNYCADIQISRDGRFLYGSNRGEDSVAVIEVQPDSGRLTLRGAVPCGGRMPRSLALTPSGRHLLVANHGSDRITILKRNPESGALADTGRHIDIGTPMCVKFARHR